MASPDAPSPLPSPSAQDTSAGTADAAGWDRRRFLLTTGAAMAGAATASLVGAAPAAPVAPVAATEVDPFVAELIADTDQLIPETLARQERRAGQAGLGGVVNEYGIFTAGAVAGFIQTLAAASGAPGSRYHRSPELVEPLRLAARHLLSLQNDDGTVDFYATNFRSPPDTAFVLELICSARQILAGSGWEGHREIVAELDRFILAGGECLVTGGVHTPNHRWVVCGALARINAIRPDPRYVARVDQWLDEGIDLDPDGQYTEKSTSVYSPIVNHALLTVARRLRRPALLDAVRRNLDMTLYYVHPDGEVVTEASRRQDRYQRGSMARYYLSYRELALKDGNGRFAAMARMIQTRARRQLVRDLAGFLEEPELQRPMPPDAALPTDYARVFSHSSLARIRRGPLSATVLAGNSTLLSLRKGEAALEAVRVASAFFGKGQFVGEALLAEGGVYRLRQRLDGPYFQPIPKALLAAGGEHVVMEPNGTLRAAGSNAARARSNVQEFETTAEVREIEGGFELRLDVKGTRGVPVVVELGFRHGGVLEGVEAVPGIADAHILASGVGRYTAAGQTITFGPGRAEHRYTQVRGALPKWDGQSVYVPAFSPTTLTLRFT